MSIFLKLIYFFKAFKTSYSALKIFILKCTHLEHLSCLFLFSPQMNVFFPFWACRVSGGKEESQDLDKREPFLHTKDL